MLSTTRRPKTGRLLPEDEAPYAAYRAALRSLAEANGTELSFPEEIRLERPDFVAAERALYEERDGKLQKSLEADPRCVSLSAQSPYFYELALQLGLNDTLQETFQQRYQKLLTPAGCWSEEAWGKVKERLTVEECALVLEAREAYARFRAWRQRHCKPASGAHPIVSNKRKRVQTFGSSDRARHQRVL